MQRQNRTPLRCASQIAIDDRERSSGVADALSRRPGVNLTTRRLSLGDYEVDKNLIVERKTLADFAVSVLDGRLFRQAARLARNPEVRTCLILEGTPERYPRLAISTSAFQGALITVTLVYPATIGMVFGRRCTLPACTSLPLNTKGMYRSRSTGRKAPRRPRYFTPIMAGHTGFRGAGSPVGHPGGDRGSDPLCRTATSQAGSPSGEADRRQGRLRSQKPASSAPGRSHGRPGAGGSSSRIFWQAVTDCENGRRNPRGGQRNRADNRREYSTGDASGHHRKR